MDLIQLFLDHPDVDLNAEDENSVAPLHLAAAFGDDNGDLIRTLLATGKVNPFAKDDDDDLAIHFAAQRKKIAALSILLDIEGMDVTARGKGGSTCLHFAASNGHAAMMRMLLERKGVNINAFLKKGGVAVGFSSENQMLPVTLDLHP